MKLNLACGKVKLDGWENIDIAGQVAPDYAVDLLRTPWKEEDRWQKINRPKSPDPLFTDSSVDEILCLHFIEHIGDEFIPFMDECHRVLKPGGTFRIRAPYYTSMRAVQDPTHKRFICEATFHYFNAEWRKTAGVDHYPIKADFDIEEMRFHFPAGMVDLAEEERKYLLTHAWNTAADIEVLLKKHDERNQSVDRQKNGGVLLT